MSEENIEVNVVKIDRMPLQSFIDKTARNNSILRLGYTVDCEKKTVTFEVPASLTTTTFRTFNFSDTAKELGWKDVVVSEDKMYVIPVLDAPFEHEEVTGTMDAKNPDHIINIDKHFYDKDYSWLSKPRITVPMNNSMEGVDLVNALISRNGNRTHIVIDDSTLKIAESIVTKEEDPDNPFYDDSQDESSLQDDEDGRIEHDDSSEFFDSEFFDDDGSSSYTKE